MIDKKKTGSYYTPQYLSDFITKRVIENLPSKTVNILEPSVGDGSFVTSLKNIDDKSITLTAFDTNKNELDKASLKWKNNKNFFEEDFLEVVLTEKFSAIIGNPPYIKKKLLSKVALQKIKDIHFQAELSENSISNIWIAFLLKSITLLKKSGVIAFVLPSELLQVQYAREVREFLITKFTRIEIFTFNDLMFDCKGQDTVLFFGYLQHNDEGQFFSNIESQDQLLNNDFLLRKNQLLVENDTKWSHHFLNENELNTIIEIKESVKKIGFYAESKPGIVTAANDFFILNTETEEQYNLQELTYPIIKKGLYVNGKVTFDKNDLFKLDNKKIPTRLLNIRETDKLSESVNEYLRIGEDSEIHLRYKTLIRNKWYVIPNVSTVPKAFFFKRAHLYPKLLKNDSKAYVTDSAYKIDIKPDYNINSFVFSFYNSLTLLFAELYGRYYGGGVLELIPSEFKNLPLPYLDISDIDFKVFASSFEKKKIIEDILEKNNFLILNTVLGFSQKDIDNIESIRKKLVLKRTRK